ncbi:hypothetical protein PSTT_15067 [Puccinia striiformis]|uniref:Uncharacterized protein n=1 Tax=Puccinia striiformis TaxID=27350 RepID=A0A2S4UJS9_9BASI|nr:hypothetical protein PSTT_15067 [Puccinia striiformis]
MAHPSKQLSGTCPHPSPRDGSRGIRSNLELISTTSSDIPFYLDPMGCARRYMVTQIAEEEEIKLDRRVTQSDIFSNTFNIVSVHVAPNHTFAFQHLALELKAFNAAHAGRCTEDVKLVCRKSTVLQELLEQEAQRCNTTSSTLTAAATKNVGIKPKKLSKPKPVRVGGLAGTSTSRNPIA